MRRAEQRLSRRDLLCGTVAAGAAAACGSMLTACGPWTSAAATPSNRSGVLEVPVNLYIEGVPQSPMVQALLQSFFDSTFNSRQKGIRAIVGFQQPAQTTVARILSGKDVPAIVSGFGLTWPTVLPFLTRLDAYLQQDNIPASTWGRGQLGRFRTPDGLYGLPEDAASDVYLYRQDILDTLGLQYPAPDWTAAEAAQLWRSCSGQTSHGWRFGANGPFSGGSPAGLSPVVAGFGGSFMDTGQTRCLLDQPGSILAGQYWLHLVWDKVLTNGGGVPNPLIASGQLVFNTSADPTVLYAVQVLGPNIKWDFIPWPRFPVRPVGNLHDNFYAMVSSFPRQDVAWELLKFIAIEPEWSRYYMKLALTPPMLAGMMDEWYTILRTTAPILQGKHVEYWGQPTLNGWGIYDNEYFEYSPVQAQNALLDTWAKVWDHKLGVSTGFRQIAQQIDALEVASTGGPPPATGAQLIAAQQRMEQRIGEMMINGS